MNVNKDNVTVIDGKKYVLKKVTQLKSDGGEALGKVPVPYYPDSALDEYLEDINEMTEYELKKHRDDWFYGCGVRLQGQARADAKGEGYSQDDYDRIWETLTGEELTSFAGNKKGLTAHIKELWDAEQAENPTTYGKDYVWKKFCK